MQEYPKALYIDKKKSSIAKNAEHEKKLREIGFVDYSEAPEPINENIGQTEPQVNDVDLITVEQFEELGEKLAKTEKELSAAHIENSELKKRIISLDKRLIEKDYEDKSADELREILNQREVKFGARDNKDVLVQLVVKSDPPHMYEVDQLGE